MLDILPDDDLRVMEDTRMGRGERDQLNYERYRSLVEAEAEGGS